MSRILEDFLNKECIITVSVVGNDIQAGVKVVYGKIIDLDENYVKFQASKTTLGAVKKDEIAVINQRYIIAINLLKGEE